MKRLIADINNLQIVASKIYTAIESYIESNYNYSNFKVKHGYESQDDDHYIIEQNFPLINYNINKLEETCNTIAINTIEQNGFYDYNFEIKIGEFVNYISLKLIVYKLI